MRLTLRTLLAWMDDTLPPAEVKEIGQQVSTSPLAQQLMERIRKATRRRRLTIPPASGDEASDPNLVAAYLDNELDAERVAEYEKLCLASDVNLAEAASCHQILSMIKHKAKVPAEARYHMYRLVKGRESTRPTARGRGEAAPSTNGGPSVPPWAGAAPPKAPAWERFGPPLLAAALMGVLGWVGLSGLRPPAPSPALVANDRADAPAQPGPAVPVEPLDDEEAAVDEPVVDEAAERVEPPAAEAATEPEPEPAADEVPAPVAKGAAGAVATSDGLLLKAGDGESWDRLKDGEELRPGDRLVHLEPLTATVRLGEVPLALVGESEVVVGTPEEGQAARFDLVRGRVVLAAAAAADAAPVAVGFEGKVLTVKRPTKGSIGLVAFGARPPGQPAGRMLLSLHVEEGEALVSADPAGPSEAIAGPGVRVFDPASGFGPVQASAAPPWVADPKPGPADRQRGTDFAALFGDGTLVFSLLEGVEDARPAVQGLSVAALGAIGADDHVFVLLGRPNAPALRRAALGVIQARLAERPDALATLHPMFEKYAESPEVAAELERLSVGLTQEDVAKESTYARLVRDLSSPNPSVRELAISALMGLTRRDALGYDPDAPEAGAKAWQQLLREGQLRPSNPPAPEAPAPRPGG